MTKKVIRNKFFDEIVYRFVQFLMFSAVILLNSFPPTSHSYTSDPQTTSADPSSTCQFSKKINNMLNTQNFVAYLYHVCILHKNLLLFCVVEKCVYLPAAMTRCSCCRFINPATVNLSADLWQHHQHMQKQINHQQKPIIFWKMHGFVRLLCLLRTVRINCHSPFWVVGPHW